MWRVGNLNFTRYAWKFLCFGEQVLISTMLENESYKKVVIPL
jgi:hypothetical protein